MARVSAGAIVLVFVLVLFINTVNNSQAPNTTQKAVNQGIGTKMLKTTFDHWPAEGLE